MAPRKFPKIAIAGIIILTCQVCSASMVSVSDFGADPKGTADSRQAIQKAITSCNQAGGGVVFFPRGIYRTGTIYLKDNVTLQINEGATLKASTDMKDYDDIDVCYDKDAKPHFVIFGNQVRNAAIVGQGTIDGSGQAFWGTNLKPVRPKTIHLYKCENIRIEGITIRNSPCYNIWMLGCDNIRIASVNIISPRHSPNTDGIDIDCSSNVFVNDCHINTGDDCIAIKSDAYRLCGNKPCERIIVTNCTLRTYACGIRVGYEGKNAIRDCVFTNLVIYDTDTGIDIVSILPKPGSFGLRIDEAAKIERLAFSNIVMDEVNQAFYLWSGREIEGDHNGFIRDISISNVVARANNASYIGGMSDGNIENVSLNNIQQIMYNNQWYNKGHDQNSEDFRPGWSGWLRIPHALYVDNAVNLQIRNFNLRWEHSAQSGWKSAIWIQNSQQIQITGFTGRNHSDSHAAIVLKDVAGAFVNGCYAAKGCGTFAEVMGKQSSDIVLNNNFLNFAKRELKYSGGAEKK